MVKLKRDENTGFVMALNGNKLIGTVYTMGDYIEQSEEYEKRGTQKTNGSISDGVKV